MHTKSTSTSTLLALLALAGSASLHAQVTWTGATNGIWGTDSNWSTATAPTSSDAVTILGPSNAAGALTINVAAAAAANSINVTNTAATTLSNTTSGANQTLTIGSGGLTTGTGAVTIGSSTANQNINIALGASQTWSVGSGNMTVNNVISGTGFALTKSGAGTLSLLGANTYSGGMTVNAGIMDIQNNAALGTGTTTLAGGTLQASGAADRTITNNIVAQASTTSTLATNGRNLTINGNISGSGNINRSAPGTATTVALGGDNSGFTGTFTQAASGNAVVSFTNVNAGSASASWVFQNTTAGRTRIGLGGAGVNGTISFGSMTGNGTIQSDVTGTKTISAGALGLTDTFSGVIANGSGTVALTKVGTGTWTLSGSNTYTGGTNINAGAIQLNHANALGTSGTISFGGGALKYGTVTTDLSARFSNAAGQAYKVDTNGNNVTFASALTSSGGTFEKSGTGVLTLSAANTYGGATTISAGTLALGASGSLVSSSGIQIATGAIFNTSAQSFTMLGGQTVTFGLDGGGAGSAGLFQAAALDIGAGSVSFNLTGGALDDASYVLANYSSISGTAFATVNNLPAGYALDYNYLGGNQIALVAIPEPSTFAALAGLAGLAMVGACRRRR